MQPLMRRHDDHRPWGLIVALVIAATAGVISLPLQVFTFRNLNAASKADVQRTQELTAALARQQAQEDAEARKFRQDTRLLTLAICDQIEAVAEQADLKVPPCPRVTTQPSALPSPTPPAAFPP